MKSVKKVFLAVVLLVLAVSVSAQLNFGVKAGFNASTISNFKEFVGDDASMNFKPGFHVGVAAQYMFAPQMGIEAGLFYSTLGVKSTDEYTETEGGISIKYKEEVTAKPSYLQLPIAFVYKMEVGQDLFLCPSLGIYCGYGIGGKVEAEVTGSAMGISASDKVEMDIFGKGTDDVPGWEANSFDMGATVGLAIQYTKFTIGLGYDLGLSKLNGKDWPSNMKDLKNGNIRVSVGYFF